MATKRIKSLETPQPQIVKTRVRIIRNLHYSMLENGAKIPKEIVGFMGNFDALSHSNSGRYIKSHPRMF